MNITPKYKVNIETEIRDKDINLTIPITIDKYDLLKIISEFRLEDVIASLLYNYDTEEIKKVVVDTDNLLKEN